MEGMSLENIKEVNERLLKECTEKWKEVYKELSGEKRDFSGIFLIKNFVTKDPKNQKKMDELKDLLLQLELNSIILEDESAEEKNEELKKIKVSLESIL